MPNAESAPPARRGRFPRWLGPAAGVLVVALLVAWGAREMGFAAFVQRGVDHLRTLGAPVFFLAMALLPAVGFPLLPFALAAGPAFAPQLGVAGVIACALAAVGVNVALSYALAATLVRGPVQALVRRFGYQLPDPNLHNPWLVTLLVRVAPGPPFWVQSYALGLLRVQFRAYLTVSTLVPAGYLSAAILFGDALMRGRPRAALLAAGLLGVLAAAFVLIRRRLARVPANGGG